MRKIKGNRFWSSAFDAANGLFLVLLSLSMLYPFLYILSMSFKAYGAYTDLSLIPKEFSFNAYRTVFRSELIYYGFFNSVVRTVLGTVLTLVATVLAAYPLSKPYFPNRIFWTVFILVSMFFSGGLIPTYMLVRSLNMIDSIWALVIPGLVTTSTVLLVRNFLRTLPESVEESARMDGANDIVVLFRIVIPMAAPIIATVTLWTAVRHWNEWFDALIYITKIKNQVLMVMLQRILVQGTTQMMKLNAVKSDIKPVNPDFVKAATIIVTMLPILVVYPLLQKHYVKGMMLGSVKG